MARLSDPEHASLDDVRRVHATNLEGVFLGCKHAIAAMRPHGQGSIINLGSRGCGCARQPCSRPLRRFGTVAEIAALALHLAADESAYTTGAEFNIDGGLLAGSAATPRAVEG